MNEATRKGLSNLVAEELNIKKKEGVQVTDVVLDKLIDLLLVHGKVQIAGFGTLSIKETESRKGRNPRTKEELEIPASKRVKFSPAKQLKDRVKQS